MQYQNPILRGMYPDPSVCRAGDRYYMVCSSMNYFPGVPLFESEDMVNWKPIGHCLTRESQLNLAGAEIISGIFAPTIRYHGGRFYMVTTNAVRHENFYVYTDDIYGEWSDPVFVKQEGIDPSLYFENGKAYFISNGGDEKGSCIIMSEINLETGELLTPPKALWRGTGGRFMEAPHLYKIGEYYYVLDAEGGTEYGHMVNYGRSKSLWGPFEPFPGNPVLTNRNLGGYLLQGAGHGDLLEDRNGNWWFVHLAFRQEGQWAAWHHLGRETCLVPVEWKDGWFFMGDGTSALSYDLPGRPAAPQKRSYRKTFATVAEHKEWCFLRRFDAEKYTFGEDYLTLTGAPEPLDCCGGYPVMAAVRQCEFRETVSCRVEGGCQEAGLTLFMDEKQHYDFYLDKTGDAVLRLTIGGLSKEVARKRTGESAALRIEAEEYRYVFYEGDSRLGSAETKYLSTEVAGGFTGVVLGLYAVDNAGARATFRELEIVYTE